MPEVTSDEGSEVSFRHHYFLSTLLILFLFYINYHLNITHAKDPWHVFDFIFIVKQYVESKKSE